MKKSPPVSTFSTPYGRHSILYGIHIRGQNPADIPDDASAVVLETGMHQYLKDQTASLERLRHHVQYRELFEELEARKLPVYFVDLKYRYPDPLLIMADTAFSGLEWMAGMRVLRKKNKKPLDYLVGGWLLMPFITNTLRLGSAFTGVGMKESGELKKISHRLHPEADFLYLTLRNTVIAEKETYLMQTLGKKPHLVTVLGAGHVGIEDSLQLSETTRHELLRKYVPILSRFANKPYVYTAVGYRFTGKQWQEHDRVEVPFLKDLYV